ncbi:hypothetical protein Tco_0326676 [Tanacetum coccineum]
MYSCELCGNNAYYGYDCPPQVPLVYEPEPCYNKLHQDFHNNIFVIKDYRDEKIDIEININELKENFNGMSIEINKKKKLQQLEQSSHTAITPNSPITDSLIMEDKHLDTIPETESDEENESSVKDLNLTTNESEDLSDIESKCDIPVCVDLTTFSNPLFDSNNDFNSSDDESLYAEDVPQENFKIYSNPLFDEEIISTKIDPHHFNVESDLIESLLNPYISIVSSTKFDSLIEEFFGELAHIDLISPEIDEADFDPEEEIQLLTHDPLSLPKNESFHFDRYYVPSSPRPPGKPPDDDDVYFDIEPDTGVFIKVVDDISDNSTRELYVHVPNVLSTLSPMFDTLLLFLSKNDDKLFNPGILASNEEKSPLLLSHRGFKAFQDCPDYEASRALGFILRSLELQSFHTSIWESYILDFID